MSAMTVAGDRSRLLQFLAACRGREVWVVGDIMLDEYVQGAVDRISPEAPVPVVKVRDEHSRLGGAANVARQVAALGARASLGGIVGADDAAAHIVAECGRLGIDTRGVVQDGGRRTTRKLRVLGHGQQLVRLDWEDARACDAAAVSSLCERLASGTAPDVLILSDYAKGVLTDHALQALVAAARERGSRVVVDPKRRDLSAYRGASFLTPNLGELAAAAGRVVDPDDHLAVASAALPFIHGAELEGIIVTLSERGMLLVRADGSTHAIPAQRRAVSDVTGAGDTAVAVLASMLAAGATVEQAMTIANVAAGLAVAEVGTVAIEPGQIDLALADIPGGKIVARAELGSRAAAWRAAGKRIVFTNGCYDLLHAGHLSLLQKAAAMGDVLVLAINSDESVRRLKGPSRPIVTASDRAALLAGLGCVDAVTIFEEDTPLETLRVVRPQVLVKGEDYGIDRVVGREFVESIGGRVQLVPLLDERSTSAIVERIRRVQAGA
jgi:D-beta-D-heptose 7-phosphate kinase/D-beta-D-heptose 1-phosphate adenosyltransferase